MLSARVARGPAAHVRRLAIAVLCICSGGVSAFAQPQPPATARDLADLSLEDLMRLTVVTASRTEEQLPRSTSVISVVTARDIERAGFRTVYEVLTRIPGFFPSSQATWKVLGSRGLVADGNDHILLLIDGHAQNSIVAHGFQQQDQMPVLEKVARIEIIRGPGSVLWGTSAAHAIVNIVTKDEPVGGKELQVSTGYTHGDDLWNVSLLKNLSMGEAQGLFSATVWQAGGYNTSNGPNVKFPWGASGNLWPRLDAQHTGFELYFKLKDDDGQQMLARLADTSVPYPWDSWSYDPSGGVRPGAELRMRKAYLDYQKTRDYSDRFKVHYTLYGDLLLQNRFPLGLTSADASLDTRWIEDQSREELAFGGEATSTYLIAPGHTMRFGSKYVHTVVGPNRGFRFDTSTNLPTLPGTGEEQVPFVDIPSGNDNNVAVYAEDRLNVNDGRTDVFAGARADYNDWRERRIVLLPRAGVIHSLSRNLTAKYVFNTGYLRPNAAYAKSGGKFYRSPSKTIEDVGIVDRSERVRSHDWQITLAGPRDYLVGTVFHMSVDHFISWETKLDLGYRNMGSAYSYGLELEGRRFLTDRLAFTGNYSLARGFLRTIPTGVDVSGAVQSLDGALTNSNRQWLNYPRHTWNAGADYSLHERHSLNVNARGWHQMPIVAPFNATTPGSYDELTGEVYVDSSYQARDVLPNLDFRISATNLFNNMNPVGMVINNGVYHPRGRSLGIQLATRF